MFDAIIDEANLAYSQTGQSHPATTDTESYGQRKDEEFKSRIFVLERLLHKLDTSYFYGARNYKFLRQDSTFVITQTAYHRNSSY